MSYWVWPHNNMKTVYTSGSNVHRDLCRLPAPLEEPEIIDLLLQASQCLESKDSDPLVEKHNKSHQFVAPVSYTNVEEHLHSLGTCKGRKQKLFSLVPRLFPLARTRMTFEKSGREPGTFYHVSDVKGTFLLGANRCRVKAAPEITDLTLTSRHYVLHCVC